MNAHPATMTKKNGTKLSYEDVQDICNLVRNGISYRDIQKKYKIGGGRLSRILRICNVKSIINGGWEDMPIPQPNDLDNVIDKQIDQMKKSINNIQFKSFL